MIAPKPSTAAFPRPPVTTSEPRPSRSPIGPPGVIGIGIADAESAVTSASSPTTTSAPMSSRARMTGSGDDALDRAEEDQRPERRADDHHPAPAAEHHRAGADDAAQRRDRSHRHQRR